MQRAQSSYQSGKLAEAANCCRQIIAAAPENADAMHLLGLSLAESGAFEEGIRWLKRALEKMPQSPDIHFNLGNIFQSRGRIQEASACFEAVIRIQPDHGSAYYNLGNLCLGQKRFEDAVAHFNRAKDIRPENPGVWHNLGVALTALGRLESARSCYLHAVRIEATPGVSLNSLGILLKDTGDLAGARDCFRKIVSVRPDYVPGWTNLGNVCLAMSDLEAAEDAFTQALRLSPDSPEVHYNRATLLQERGLLEESLAEYRNTLALKPDYPVAACQLFLLARQGCDWPLAEKWGVRVAEDTEKRIGRHEKPAEMPFVNIIRDMDPDRNLQVARAWSRRFHGRRAQCPLDEKIDGGGKRDTLTIGYLSRDFRNHPVGLLVCGMLSCHDRTRFQVFGYAYGPSDDSDARKTMAAGCDRFFDIGVMSDRDAAEKIHRDGVDILVDLTGHTRGNRMGILAFKPAAIQVSYLGFLSSSGAPFMDYIITDRLATPPEEAPHYTEKFVYMPHSFMATDNRQAISDKVFSRKDFGLPENGFVFCSFNNPYKIDPAVFSCWMRILKGVPESVLWLFSKNDRTAANLKREAKARGVSADRLIFAGKVPLETHIARLRLADLALDTWCYNGGATTANTLWAGVPVISLPGDHFVSRMGASCLSAMGLRELIAKDEADYEHLAVHLGTHLEELGRLRTRVEECRNAAPLFNTPLFTRNVEAAYSAMWERYAAGKPPAQIALT